MKIEYVRTEQIKGSEFNPKSRIEKKALKKLRDDIEKWGILNPLHISKNNILADGHRRLACAIEIGLETVPVIRHDIEAADLWVILNEANMPIKPRTWLEAVHYGLPIDLLPPNEASSIREIYRVGGEELVSKLVGLGKSSYVITMAQWIGRYVDDLEDDFIRTCIEWLVDHRQSFNARRAMADGIEPDVMYKAISDGKPIKETWGIA